ncbi:unnamed protein product [Prorocentrum cordatum]|uniref:Uncharacterized protein n=1 Tax=Prorocentrum cordatum TaxID=2364126 RepID=A0ABN9TJW1_9DINO|nr:unnamed protein product [Polarella glacialis]
MMQAAALWGPLRGIPALLLGPPWSSGTRTASIGERLAELEQWAGATTRPFIRRLARLRQGGSSEQGVFVQVVLQGQTWGIRKPAADYLAALVQLVGELRLSPAELEEIESLPLEGEAELIEQMAQAGKHEDRILNLLEFESSSSVLLDALGVLGGAGRGEEACEETEYEELELLRDMEPRRLSWFRGRVAAMWLARKAE